MVRLQTGACTIQLGFVLNDLLGNFERVSDHCSNIAVSVIEEHGADVDSVGPHAYIEGLKADGTFTSTVASDLEKYRLPNA